MHFDMLLHAYDCRYEKYAWGRDELLPEQQSSKNSFAGMGATLVDGLSTLWLMGLRDEFYRGRDWVAKNLIFPKDVVGLIMQTVLSNQQQHRLLRTPGSYQASRSCCYCATGDQSV